MLMQGSQNSSAPRRLIDRGNNVAEPIIWPSGMGPEKGPFMFLFSCINLDAPFLRKNRTRRKRVERPLSFYN